MRDCRLDVLFFTAFYPCTGIRRGLSQIILCVHGLTLVPLCCVQCSINAQWAFHRVPCFARSIAKASYHFSPTKVTKQREA